VNNAPFIAHVGLAIDAVRLAGTFGIGEEAILSAVQLGSGGSKGRDVVARGDTVASIPGHLGDLMLKDVTVVREVAGRSGADVGIIGTVLSSRAVEEKVLGRTTETERVAP
jgi:3-hydroxyisobutyrate dehydrogenase